MKTSIYQIIGCRGSLRPVEIESGLAYRHARKEATARNQQNADRLGLSYRAYCARSMGGEGWHYAARSGKGRAS